MQILLNDANIRVTELAGQPGGKVIEVLTQSGTLFMIPLPEKAAKEIAAALGSGIIIASGPLATNGRPQ